MSRGVYPGLDKVVDINHASVINREVGVDYLICDNGHYINIDGTTRHPEWYERSACQMKYHQDVLRGAIITVPSK